MAHHSLDALFSALADATRRAVIERLANGSASVKTLADQHDMTLPSFLKHLRIMEDGGLIVTRKDGRTRFCHLAPNALIPLQGWLEWQRQVQDAAL